MPLLIKTPNDWANALLGALGLPDTKNNVDNLLAFWGSEGGGGSGFPGTPSAQNPAANFNPLNTVLVLPGSSSINSSGVESYTDWQEGLDATISELEQTNFAEVYDNLAKNAPWSVFSQSGDWGNNISGDTVPSTGTVEKSTYGTANKEAKAGTLTNVETNQNALARLVAVGSSPSSTGGTTGTTSADKPSSNAKTQTFKGFAGVLQQLNGWFNPESPGLISSVTSLGGTDIKFIATLIFTRATSSLLFISVAGIGVLMLVKGGGSGGGGGDVFEFVQNNENIQRQQAHETAVQTRHERSTSVREQEIRERRNARIYRGRQERERARRQGVTT